MIVTFSVGCTTCFSRVCEDNVRSVPVNRCRNTRILNCSGKRAFFHVMLPRIVEEILPTVAGRVMALIGSASLTSIISCIRIFTGDGRVTGSRADFVPFVMTNIFCCIFGIVITFIVKEVRGGVGCCAVWKKFAIGILGVRGVTGSFNSGSILGGISLGISGNRIISVVKPSNSNGSALLHYTALLRAISDKVVACLNGGIARVGGNGIICTGGLGDFEGGFNLIFRDFGLFPRCDMLRGVVSTPMRILGGSGGRTVTRTGLLLGGVKLRNGRGLCPYRLSNNVRREISVIETLTVGPRVLFFSRPADTLSPRLANRILGMVGRLTRRGVAVMVIARRVSFTRTMSSEIVFVSGNVVIRRNGPRSIFRGASGRHAHRFLDDCGAGRCWVLYDGLFKRCGYFGGCQNASGWVWGRLRDGCKVEYRCETNQFY